MAESLTEIHDRLRLWARGMYTTEQATELLIRAANGSYAAMDGRGSRLPMAATGSTSQSSTNTSGALSGGEQRILRIAAPSTPTRHPR